MRASARREPSAKDDVISKITPEKKFLNFDLLKNKQKALITGSIRDAAVSVLPVVLLVLVLTLIFFPVTPDLLVSFLIGACLVTAGLGFFTLGVDISMTPIGNTLGTSLTKTKNLPLILAVSFAMGFAVTVSEPDLQVLAANAPHIDSAVLTYCVAAGVGFFMMLCMLRIIRGGRLRSVLLISYIPLLVMAFFTETDFLPVAFDSGGVTTGPMTVPFILAFGIGVSNIRSDANAEADSFGLVGLSSAGPILAVLILGFFYHGSAAESTAEARTYSTTRDITLNYLQGIPEYMKEMAFAILPVVAFFVIFQLVLIRMGRKRLARVVVGLVYAYAGLVLFMTGVNVGFSEMGRILGSEIASSSSWLLIPVAMLFGITIIAAEPAVTVLKKQIEDVSSGAVPGKAVETALRLSVMLAMGFAAVRVLTDVSLLWFIIPGYAAAFILSFMIPDLYTNIAFDTGGTASGPMTASFMLPFMIGACSQTGGSMLADAFGVVSLVALLPIISVEVVGLIYGRAAVIHDQTYGDFDIIDLWEEG